MAGLISGGQTVAVVLQEALDASRVTTGTIVATKAGTWGLGVYVQTSDNRCAAVLPCAPVCTSLHRHRPPLFHSTPAECVLRCVAGRNC